MRIALLLRNNDEYRIKDTEQVIVFTVEGDKVVGVENERLSSKKMTHLSFWAMAKKINEIYLPEVNEGIQKLFYQIGIALKGYDEMAESQLLRNYIV